MTSLQPMIIGIPRWQKLISQYNLDEDEDEASPHQRELNLESSVNHILPRQRHDKPARIAYRQHESTRHRVPCLVYLGRIPATPRVLPAPRILKHHANDKARELKLG